MEQRRFWDIRKIVSLSYFGFLVAFLMVGLRPVEASPYEITGEIGIPSIGLTSDVTELALSNRELLTPDTIVGSFTRAENKTLLIGHSSTVFHALDKVQVGDGVNYNGMLYIVKKTEVLEKSKISMETILAPATRDTLIVMTCAGEDLGGGDASHRLILTAERETL